MTISNYFENKLLESLRNASAAVAEVYVKLHTGDPGEECTANVATEATRKKITLAVAASGQTKNSANIEWPSVSATEVIRYVSLWDNSVAGNPLWSGPLAVEKSLTAGDTLLIKAEQLTITLD